MTDTTHITVLIAGRSYPLVVDKVEEQVVLQTVKAINERVTQLQAQFQSKDKQDCLAMCLLEFTISQVNTSNTPSTDTQAMHRTLNRLEQSIDEMLE
jgi:cell division protein ZapA (FtsZ GTPase activity inhibitor)